MLLVKPKNDEAQAPAGGAAQGADRLPLVVEGWDASVSTVVHAAVGTTAMEAGLTTIECGFIRGFAGLQMIGHASEVCRDGKERARVALEALGLHIPPRRLVLSLTPADVKMDGNQFDLPIAVSLALLLAQKTPVAAPERWLFAAELGLDGSLRPVRGTISFTIAAMSAGLDGIVISPENLAEVTALTALAETVRVQVRTFASLSEVLAWIFGEADRSAGLVEFAPQGSTQSRVATAGVAPARASLDFDDMFLTDELELAAVVACSGLHSLFLRGSPGTGKSMLSSRLASILPPLERQEHIEALRIYSTCAERLPAALLAGRPPFRAPHHQASAAAALGTPEMPGELALAHGGLLFLDELPEFRRDLLESLREPLETGEVRVSRSRHKVVWKARVILVAACNNCPCGWAGSARKVCDCGPSRLAAYRARLSGPILDRIDIHINMPEPDDSSAALFLRLDGGGNAGRTARMAAQVIQARAVAAARNAAFGVLYNSQLDARHLVAASGLTAEAFSQLVNAVIPNTLSSRAALRCLRVARTLADLRGRPALAHDDVVQAWRWQSESAARARGEALPQKAPAAHGGRGFIDPLVKSKA